MKAKEMWKKFWFMLWKDDSMKGWIFSVVFLFVFIKFIFFPFLSLATGTILPLAIVESCSMYHEDNLLSKYDSWWDKHQNKYEKLNIVKTSFDEFIFKKGFNKGDILFILGTKAEKIEVGDVIIFSAGASSNPIIHRVIEINREKSINGEEQIVFVTIGDNNNGQLSFEKKIKEDQLIGRAVFKLAPYLGWGKLIFFEHLQPSSNKGFCDEN